MHTDTLNQCWVDFPQFCKICETYAVVDIRQARDLVLALQQLPNEQMCQSAHLAGVDLAQIAVLLGTNIEPTQPQHSHPVSGVLRPDIHSLAESENHDS